MRTVSTLGIGIGILGIVGGLVLGACKSGKNSTFGDGSGASSNGADGGSGNTGNVGATGGGINFGGGDQGGGQGTCDAGPDQDKDGDGYTINQGDCNDCDPNVSPGAIEAPTDPNDPAAVPADENCDGQTDEPILPCDDGLALTDPDPLNGAKAMDICHTVAANGFGLENAQYVRADGTPFAPGAMVGIQSSFGPNVPPRKGANMLALSSGHARLPGQPDACGTNLCENNLTGTAPPGFPQDMPGCGGGGDIYDDVALQVQLKAPTNAKGYSFDFSFYSFEYPEWVCTTYNDQFIALVNPPPQGSINGNICFDSNNQPVSVNIAFFQVCSGCPLGTDALAGTGYDTWDDAGATGWLVTTAPIGGGEEATIRFTIWDTGDMVWDSTVLLDDFQWIATPGTVVVGTNPVPR
jgi:hypothetical protein